MTQNVYPDPPHNSGSRPIHLHFQRIFYYNQILIRTSLLRKPNPRFPCLNLEGFLISIQLFTTRDYKIDCVYTKSRSIMDIYA